MHTERLTSRMSPNPIKLIIIVKHQSSRTSKSADTERMLPCLPCMLSYLFLWESSPHASEPHCVDSFNLNCLLRDTNSKHRPKELSRLHYRDCRLTQMSNPSQRCEHWQTNDRVAGTWTVMVSHQLSHWTPSSLSGLSKKLCLAQWSWEEVSGTGHLAPEFRNPFFLWVVVHLSEF